MTTNNKKSLLEKCMNTAAPSFFLLAFLAMIAFLCIGQVVMPDERDMMVTECEEFNAKWQQILEDGKRVDIEFPGKIEADWGELVTIVTTLPDDLYNGESICFRPIWQDVDIYIDGELRESYTTAHTRPFGKNSAFRCLFVQLTEADAGKELVYQFSSESKYAGTMRTAYIGDYSSIWFFLMEEYGARAMISVFLLMMSFFCIIVCTVFRVAYKRTLPLTYLAWALFLCALWMFSEVEFRQIIFKNVSVLTSVTYWCLMLIDFPMILYMNASQKGRYSKLYAVPAIYTAVVLVGCTFFQVLNIKQFVEMLPLVHVGIGATILCIIGTIMVDTYNKKIKEYLAVGIGIYALLISAVLEIALYYVDVERSLGTVLAAGLVFLLAMAIVRTGQELLESEKKKQEAIMAKDAQAKFLANMSHEIRTPINAVIGMNEMILRENEDETVRGYAQDIQSASNMLLELVNEILDFSKIESGQLEYMEDTYHIGTLIQDEKLLLNARVAGKPISTKIDVDPQIPSKLFGDELRIKQVLTNLLSNAVKYTKRGNVTLTVSFEWKDKETILLCFSVEDTGAGIKQEDLPQLFDKFKRLDLNKNRTVEGTGLGLNIVKHLVEHMQGEIKVESEYGKGSVFTVFIPQKVMDKTPVGNYEQSARENRDANAPVQKEFTAPHAKLLVVDDNSMNLTLLKALLKRTKIQVDTAISGKVCLELTEKQKYDMILMDHMMPELDGVETLYLLRADQNNPNKDTIVVALTANAVEGSREMYLEYGFNDYFSKPIQADKLDELLLNYLPKSLVHMGGASKANAVQEIEEGSVSNTDRAESDRKTPEMSVTAIGEENNRSLNPDDSGNNFDGAQSYVTDSNVNRDANVKGDIMMEVTQEIIEPLLKIDKELGLSYCLNSEDIYQEILAGFCEQVEEYLSPLDVCYNAENWEQYIIITHALKGNSLNIGASDFSKLSLQHELAGKERNIDFIKESYPIYLEALKQLYEKVKGML